MRSRSLFAVGVALCATFFFAFTFVFNRDLVASGGHWEWAIILRYVITLPFLALALPWKGGLGELPAELRAHPRPWIVWSCVAFALFGIPLTWAANSGPSWLVAGSFQTTVLAGPLLAPFIYRDERARWSRRTLAIGMIIVAGILALQWGYAGGRLGLGDWIAAGAVIFAAFVYPLGNRMLLLHLETSAHRVGALQRVFGMTLCTLPIWLVFAAITWATIGPPTPREILLGSGVAVFSGTIATVLFYAATDLVHTQPAALAAVEAMQSAELLFATLLGVLLIGEAWPQGWSALGAAAIIVGILLSAWVNRKESAPAAGAARAPLPSSESV